MTFNFANEGNFLSFLTLKQNAFLVDLMEAYNKAPNENKHEMMNFVKRLAVAKDMLKDVEPMSIEVFIEFLRGGSQRVLLELAAFFAPHIELGPDVSNIRTSYLIGLVVTNVPQTLQQNFVFRGGMLAGARLFECNGLVVSVDLLRLMVFDYVTALNRAIQEMSSEPSFIMHRIWEEFMKLEFSSLEVMI